MENPIVRFWLHWDLCSCRHFLVTIKQKSFHIKQEV